MTINRYKKNDLQKYLDFCLRYNREISIEEYVEVQLIHRKQRGVL